jgi:hypothetical protein
VPAYRSIGIADDAGAGEIVDIGHITGIEPETGEEGSGNSRISTPRAEARRARGPVLLF